MIAINAPVILNQALTVHGEVSIHPGVTQTANTVVARDPANPVPSLQQTVLRCLICVGKEGPICQLGEGDV